MTEITHTSPRRPLTGIDRLLSQVDKRLRQLAGESMSLPEAASRPSPAVNHDEPTLSPSERAHAAGLMRVNHTGEVCAQALYQGQALAARSVETREKLLVAAREEADHLAWCEARLTELDAEPSRLNPLFYTASFVLGAATAMAGDKVSLGFVHATEERVANHLMMVAEAAARGTAVDEPPAESAAQPGGQRRCRSSDTWCALRGV